MFQDRTSSNKDSARSDFIAVAAFLIILIFLRKLIDACALLSPPWNAITQGLVFAVLVALCYMIYRARISDYRYTVIHHQPEEGEENAFGKQQPYPWAEGTVLFERMVANKGKLLETIKPEEYVTLLAPGEEYTEKIPVNRSENLSPKSRKKSYTLVYTRLNKPNAVYFLPCEEMAQYIRSANEEK